MNKKMPIINKLIPECACANVCVHINVLKYFISRGKGKIFLTVVFHKEIDVVIKYS